MTIKTLWVAIGSIGGPGFRLPFTGILASTFTTKTAAREYHRLWAIGRRAAAGALAGVPDQNVIDETATFTLPAASAITRRVAASNATPTRRSSFMAASIRTAEFCPAKSATA